MPLRSALLRAIRKFLARQRKRRQRRDETSPVPQFHGFVADPTNNSFLPPASIPAPCPFAPPSLFLLLLLLLSSSSHSAVSPARYLPRSIGRSVYCFKRKSAPERNVFPVVSRASSGRALKYKQPSESRGPKLGIRLARQEVIWRVAREHLGRTESFRPPRPAPRVRVPRGTSQNCDKEVANHRARWSRPTLPSFRQSGRTCAMISFVRTVAWRVAVPSFTNASDLLSLSSALPREEGRKRERES